MTTHNAYILNYPNELLDIYALYISVSKQTTF